MSNWRIAAVSVLSGIAVGASAIAQTKSGASAETGVRWQDGVSSIPQIANGVVVGTNPFTHQVRNSNEITISGGQSALMLTDGAIVTNADKTTIFYPAMREGEAAQGVGREIQVALDKFNRGKASTTTSSDASTAEKLESLIGDAIDQVKGYGASEENSCMLIMAAVKDQYGYIHTGVVGTKLSTDGKYKILNDASTKAPMIGDNGPILDLMHKMGDYPEIRLATSRATVNVQPLTLPCGRLGLGNG